MIIDAHTHIFTPSMVENRKDYFSDTGFALLYGNPSSRMVTHHGLLEAMDGDGIDHSIVVGFPWHEGPFCREQNEYFIEAQKLSRGRISAFGSIPRGPGEDPRTWAREVRGMGLAGIGEVGFYDRGMTPETTAHLERVLEAAVTEGLPVCLHVNEPVGHRYPGKYEPGLSGLVELVSRFREAVIIFAHWGGGLIFYELMPEIKELFRNFYYDTAATPFLYDNKIYRIGVDIVGPEKILFGTDYPLLKAGRYTETVMEMLPLKEDRDKIFGGNARNLLKLKML